MRVLSGRQKKLLKHWQHRCAYCGVFVAYTKAERKAHRERTGGIAGRATIDHYVPKVLGGSNDLHNCVLACNRCNSAYKKGLHPHQLLQPEQRAWIEQYLDKLKESQTGAAR